MIRITIEEALDSGWRDVIEHQVTLTLASLRRDRRILMLRFDHEAEGRGGAGSFVVNVILEDEGSNPLLRFESRHSDGQVALTNALGRVKRFLARPDHRRNVTRRSGALARVR